VDEYEPLVRISEAETGRRVRGRGPALKKSALEVASTCFTSVQGRRTLKLKATCESDDGRTFRLKAMCNR